MISMFNNMAFSLFVPQGNPKVLALYIGVTFLIGIGVLFGLTMMPRRMRKPIVITITFLFGFFYFMEFMMPGGSRTAPARAELGAAERNLRLAQQDLYAMVVKPSEKAKRISHAQANLGSAAQHLDLAGKALAVAQTSLNKQIDSAYKASGNWAASHNVPDRLLDKSDGKINDLQSASLAKQQGDLASASEAAGMVKQTCEAIKSQIPSAPHEALGGMYAAVRGGAGQVSLAKTTITDNFLSPYKQPMGDIFLVTGAFAIGLGIISLSSLHGKMLIKKRPGWINSLAFFVAMITIAFVGFLQQYLHAGDAKTICGVLYEVLFKGGLTALSATMFSLVAFYIVSAAYRAFRVKSAEAGLMMAAAFLVMLGLVPFGVWITHGIPTNSFWSIFRFENIEHWILLFPNAAAQRGIQFGIGVGGLAMSLRLWLSLERGSYFDKEM